MPFFARAAALFLRFFLHFGGVLCIIECIHGVRSPAHGDSEWRKIRLKQVTKKLALALAVLMLTLALAACSGAQGGGTNGDLGRAFSTMFFDYTVVSAESATEYDGYTPADGNRLIVLSVKVKNDFGSTLPMYDSDFQLQWGDGDEDYAWSVDPFNDDMMPLEWELEDGKEATYDMLFEAPTDVTELSLVYLEEYTDQNGEHQTGDFYSANFTVE